jgi:putative membrane protein
VRILTTLAARLVLTALAFVVTAWLLSGVELSGGFLGALWVSFLFGLVNAVVGTLVALVHVPLPALIVGPLALFVNAVMLEITDGLTGRLTVDEFWWTAIWASILLSVVLVVLEIALAVLVERREAASPAVV